MFTVCSADADAPPEALVSPPELESSLEEQPNRASDAALTTAAVRTMVRFAIWGLLEIGRTESKAVTLVKVNLALATARRPADRGL
ncbi:hypothetical protein [Rhodococcoides kroppenstedtii]|uniref:hypothetical protein n=1 Tax=Rhodococcoides kroppenstedtii TaxID=293050 RepID=UPI003628DB3F